MRIKDIVTFVSKSITPKQGVTYKLYSQQSENPSEEEMKQRFDRNNHQN